MAAEMLMKGCASLALNRPTSPSLVCHIYGELEEAWRLAGVAYAVPLENAAGFTLRPCGASAAGGFRVAPHKGFLELELRAQWVERLYGDKCFSAVEVPVWLSYAEARVRFSQLRAVDLICARRKFVEKKAKEAVS